jgi:signal transduction histidine kinase/ligand-binding sensor domain-containing protein
VWAIHEDREGTLWVGTGSSLLTLAGQSQRGGLNRFNPEDETFTRFLHNPEDDRSLFDNSVQSIFEDSGGALWVGTRGDGLHHFDPASETFIRYPHDPEHPHRLSAPHRRGGYREIIGSANPGLGVTSIIESSTQDGVYWISGTDGGLNRYDRTTDRQTHYEHEARDPQSLIDNDVWDLYEDRAGVVWIATENGISKTDPTHAYFQHYRHDPTDPNSLSLGEVRQIIEDSTGNLWVATWGAGLNKIDRASGTVTRYRHDPTDPNSIGHDVVRSLHEDREGYIWIGNAAGLNRLDPETESFTLYQHDPADSTSLSNNLVNWIHEDRQGRFWVSTVAGGLNRMDRATGTFTSYRHDPNDPTSVSKDAVDTILEDRAGRLWIATWSGGGLNRFYPDRGRFKTYLPGVSVNSGIAEDGDGNLWIGTSERGLIHFQPDGTVLQTIGIQEGLPSNMVRGLAIDSSGSIWASTTAGLSRIDPVKSTISNFDVTDGLQGNVFTPASYFRSESGELFFGGLNGFNAFYPSAVVPNRVPPSVALTALTVFNNELTPDPQGPLRKPISQASELTLPHDQNDLTFEYVGLHYSEPTENTYQYKLMGYDSDWVDAGAQRTARYPKLPSGEYTFRVRAANSDGVWSTGDATISVSILPPWWQTNWAYVLYGLLAVGGASLLTLMQRRRVIRQERERARERELEQQRAHAAEMEEAYHQLEATHSELTQAHHELRTTQERLIQQEKMASLGELTAGIAHEIKNPLNFVNNFADLNVELFDELRGRLSEVNGSHGAASHEDIQGLLDDLRRNSQAIHEQGQRADRIVKGMMRHARGTPDKHVKTNLNELLDEYVSLSHHGTRARVQDFSVQLIRDYDARVGDLWVAPQDMGRVFINILSNAFDAVQEKQVTTNGAYTPMVKVSTRARGDHIEIRVEDNGPGIPKDVRRKVFEPFFTTKPTGTGTGLGLSLSYDIVTQGHGGTLNVESEVGEGSAFVVTLPT